MNAAIIFEKLGDIASVSLSRPEKRNALNTAILTELSAILDEISKDQDLRGVILTGKGSAFCAGADLVFQPWICRMRVSSEGCVESLSRRRS